MHLSPFSGEGVSHVHCPYGVSAFMRLKGFGVQQEDLYTVHLFKTPDAAMRVLFLVLCYVQGLGELGKRSLEHAGQRRSGNALVAGAPYSSYIRAGALEKQSRLSQKKRCHEPLVSDTSSRYLDEYILSILPERSLEIISAYAMPWILARLLQ